MSEGNEPIRILVVDDDHSILELLPELIEVALRPAHVAVKVAARPSEALRTSDSFDLAVVDIFMPEMTGIELVKRLRAQRPTLRILFITGYSEAVEGLDDECLIHKPFRIDEIRDAIEKARRRPL